MADYSPPTREMDFVIHELLDYTILNELDSFADATAELTATVLDEAGRFAAEVLSPLNRTGDTQGVRVDGDQVITADGFKEAYQLFVKNEWLSLAQDPVYGGQGSQAAARCPRVARLSVVAAWPWLYPKN